MLSLFAGGVAVASEAVVPVEKGSALMALSNMMGGLILVLVLIFVLAYIVKRLNLVPASNGVLKMVAVTPLGQKEKVVLIEVEGQQYLLGVTAQQVSLIDKLDEAVKIETNTFATRLRQAKTKQL
ncbi:flagellar biosynthetic protein FliO [Shewanella sp. D64]|uniref:flagellar biosynthetic protein FliO n=1 Tax=unclassified Shewanella TaxID=196818 RepID=UPI0022BA5FE3|nr:MULTISPECIES: flagellar biosynthetic protein FliO [unclassified Shewanella]MEC4726502.1 flagellar biosynthetic protein FliO [Shewanella sp. D64]MEC4737457.1 flagellar biosynthetic protein FliO [Shewanella sp. E94]WBJ97271.1 flagellar biosynthetic protein FliO [Shewanella sp. MTB7]